MADDSQSTKHDDIEVGPDRPTRAPAPAATAEPLWAEVGPEEEAALLRVAGLHRLERWTRLLAEVEVHGRSLGRRAALAGPVAWMRGDAFVALGRHAEGLRSYALARQAAPDDPTAHERIRRTLLEAFEELTRLQGRSRWDAAEDLALALLEADGPDDEVEWTLGVSLDQQGRGLEAEEVLRKLVLRAPLNDRHWHSLGLILAHQGRLGAALDICEHGLRALAAAGREGGLVEGLRDWVVSRCEADDDLGQVEIFPPHIAGDSPGPDEVAH